MSLTVILIAVGAAVAGLTTTIVFKLKPDNAIEEIAEEVIEYNTGLDVDLSPEDEEGEEQKKAQIPSSLNLSP